MIWAGVVANNVALQRLHNSPLCIILKCTRIWR